MDEKDRQRYERANAFLLDLLQKGGAGELTRVDIPGPRKSVALAAANRAGPDGYIARLSLAPACEENGPVPPHFIFTFVKPDTDGCCLVHVSPAPDEGKWNAFINRTDHPEFLPLRGKFDVEMDNLALDDADVTDLVGQVLETYRALPAT